MFIPLHKWTQYQKDWNETFYLKIYGYDSITKSLMIIYFIKYDYLQQVFSHMTWLTIYNKKLFNLTIN